MEAESIIFSNISWNGLQFATALTHITLKRSAKLNVKTLLKDLVSKFYESLCTYAVQCHNIENYSVILFSLALHPEQSVVTKLKKIFSSKGKNKKNKALKRWKEP